MASARLEALIEMARQREMTPEEEEAIRRDFAYGNAHIENERITREMIDRAAERLPRFAHGK